MTNTRVKMLRPGELVKVGFAPVSLGTMGGGLWPQTGNVFYVGNAAGQNGANAGGRGTLTDPLLTIDYAVGMCTANHNDFIYVLPGHVETVSAAAGLDLDVAGITLIGLGRGEARAKINFTTVVGADMDVDAANITMANFLFTGGFDALTGPIDINASDFSLIDCETRDVTGQATDFIIAGGDRFYCSGWVHRGAVAAGADTAMTIIAGDGVTVEDFWIDGNFAVAGIENVTAAATNLTICGQRRNCFIRTRHANDIAITLVSTATGNIGPNIFIRLQDDAAGTITECIVPGDCQVFDPIMVCNADTERGVLFDLTQSTG